MFRRLTLGVVLVLLAGTATAFVAVGFAGAADPGTGIDRPTQTTPDGFNNTAFQIRIYANGSAKWTVQHTTPLNSQEEEEQFRTYAERFNTEDTEVYSNFRARADRLTAFGTNVTGREMNASGFDREARIDPVGQTQGVVELSFMWSNFARTDGERVIAGDVFDGGMFIDSGQRLVIARGPDLAFASVDPNPDSQEIADNLTASETVTWFGERQFADNKPEVVFSPPAGGQGGTGTDGTPTSSATEPSDATPTATPGTAPEGSTGMLPLIVVILLVLGAGTGLAWYTGALPPSDGGATASPEAGGADKPGGDATGAPADAADGAPAEPAVAEEELLSDEDRILKLLEENGGRMKQVNIVEETEWSKSKVSMLLSDMEEEGTVSKLRVGRENIISLAGEEPDAVGSPFDDE